MHSAEERAWLTEAVTADIVTAIATFANFDDFGEAAAEFTEQNKKNISDAVARYFEKRVSAKWTETNNALFKHVIADRVIKRDPDIAALVIFLQRVYSQRWI
jgi:hypothetical protein